MVDECELKLGNRIIGNDYPCFVIAEVAQAHDGSLGAAHAYVDLASSLGADAIKFQTHIAEAETTPLEDFRIHFSYEDETRFDYWKRMEFTSEQWAGLKQHADEKGIVFLSSAFSNEAVELLENLDIAAWKIASGEVENLPMLERIAATKKPVLFSSGMSSISDIHRQYDIMQKWGVSTGFFQCTTQYPTPLENVGLNILQEMKQKFPVPVGLSDHSGSIFPSLAAMAQGANMLEQHICFHKAQFGPDTSASLAPHDFKLICEARDAFHQMAQNPVDKTELPEDLSNLKRIFSKSVTLVQPQEKGTVLTRDMLTTKKPGVGVPAAGLNYFIGKTLVRSKTHLDLLLKEDVQP